MKKLSRLTVPRKASAAGLLALLGLIVSLLPASSYAAASCGGRTTLGTSGIATHDVQYSFGCSEAIKGFGIVANTAVTTFTESANAFDPVSGAQIDKQSFECSGNIPGVGVSCSGTKTTTITGGYRVMGDIGLEKAPCDPNLGLRIWLIVANAQGATSGPFQLGPPSECKSATQPRRKHSKKKSQKNRRRH
jgi:hypothetical protein